MHFCKKAFVCTHGIRAHRYGGRHDEYDRHEKSPNTCPRIDKDACFAHVERSGLEFAKDDLAKYRNAVAPIQCNGAYVEYTKDGGVATKPNEVDGNAPEHRDPNCENRCSGQRKNFSPEIWEWYEAIARESENRASQCLHGGESDELDDEERANSEHYSAGFA